MYPKRWYTVSQKELDTVIQDANVSDKVYCACLLLLRYWNGFVLSRSCRNSKSRSKSVSKFKSLDCRKICAGLSEMLLWVDWHVTLLMSLDGIFSLRLTLRLLLSSHLLNRKYLCSSGECVSWSRSCSPCDSRPCVQMISCYRATLKMPRTTKSLLRQFCLVNQTQNLFFLQMINLSH